MSVQINGETFRTFDDMYREEGYITKEDRAIIEMETSIVMQLVAIREKQGLSQRGMSKKVGMSQSAIARLETMKSFPTLTTLTKILDPLGYTLSIVPKHAEAATKRLLLKKDPQTSEA